jgi:hypothetical protein
MINPASMLLNDGIEYLKLILTRTMSCIDPWKATSDEHRRQLQRRANKTCFIAFAARGITCQRRPMLDTLASSSVKTALHVVASGQFGLSSLHNYISGCLFYVQKTTEWKLTSFELVIEKLVIAWILRQSP